MYRSRPVQDELEMHGMIAEGESSDRSSRESSSSLGNSSAESVASADRSGSASEDSNKSFDVVLTAQYVLRLVGPPCSKWPHAK